MMTPDYASPEQVSRRGSYPASDIYSLAAVLFELLTGAKPHRFANSTLREIERAICEEEVVRPSSTVADRGECGKLKGDLDLILLTALAKDPRRRYAAIGGIHCGSGTPSRPAPGKGRARHADLSRR